MAKKKIKNVMGLAESLGEDQEFTNNLANHLGSRQLMHRLTALRAARGLTQQDVAAKMGCSQSRISKMETSSDLDLNFGVIVRYAQAVGHRLEIEIISKDAKARDRIKHHAFRIKRLTDDLAHLAGTDEKIAEGVGRFFVEAALNLGLMLEDSTKKLPAPPDDSPFVVTSGVDDPEEAQQGTGKPSRRAAKASCDA
jgi:transcriptional regulator with XRE-family HTH domain